MGGVDQDLDQDQLKDLSMGYALHQDGTMVQYTREKQAQFIDTSETAWRTWHKLAWEVPRNSHTFLVQEIFASHVSTSH